MADTDRLQEPLKQIVDANMRYYKALGQVTVDYVKALGQVWTAAAREVPGLASILPGFGATAPPPTAAPAAAPTRAAAAQPALLLEAEAGESAHAAFMVNNGLSRTVSATVVTSEFSAADGRTAQPALRIQPGTLTLEPGGRMLVQVSVLVDDNLVPGLSYRGEVSVPGLSDTPIPVVLRRKPTVQTPRREPAGAGGEDGPGGATAAAAAGGRKSSGRGKRSGGGRSRRS